MDSITIIVMVIIYLGAMSIALALWAIGRVGQMQMLKTLGYAHPIYAWFPFTSQYSLGWMAEQLENGKKPKKHSKLYLLLTIAFTVVIFLLIVVMVVMVVVATGMEVNSTYSDMPESADTVMMPFMIVMLLLLLPFMAVTYAVAIYGFVLNHMVYKIFDPEKATLYTVLSIAGVMVLSIDITSVLYFILRKKTPQNLRTSCPVYEQYKPAEVPPAPYAYDPNMQYGTQPQYGYDPNMQYGTQPQYGYDPNMQYGAQPQYGYDPNAQYGAQPQYTYDPNVQYGAQPQYGYDPNVQYGYNPNVQYGAQPQNPAQPQYTVPAPTPAPAPESTKGENTQQDTTDAAQ